MSAEPPALLCTGCNKLIDPKRVVTGVLGERAWQDPKMRKYFKPHEIMQVHEVSEFRGVGGGRIGGRMEYWMCGPIREETEDERFVRWITR